MSSSNRISQFVGECSTEAWNKGVALKNAVVQIPRAFSLENFSRALHDLYSLDGFEKWTKALISNLKLVSLLPSIRGVFDKCIEALEAQKDLYYATMSINSAASYFEKDKTTNRWVFKPFTSKEPYWYDKVCKVLLDVGNVFESLKFLQKYKVIPFETCTHLANTYGAVKIFNHRLDDINLVNTLFNKPKDFCLFFASGLQIISGYYKGASWETFFKSGSAMGKMVLIFFAKHNYMAVWFHVADFVTQNLSLFGLLYKRSQEREERFNIPAKVLNEPKVTGPKT